MSDFRNLYIQTKESMRSIKIANHENRDVGIGHHLHLRGKRKGRRRKVRKQSTNPRKQKGFVFLLISQKDYFS